MLQFADGNRIAELVAALSILSGVPIVLVSRLICDTEPFGAMAMCKAIGLEWHIAHAVLNNLPGMSDDREEKFARDGRAIRAACRPNRPSGCSLIGRPARRASSCRIKARPRRGIAA